MKELRYIEVREIRDGDVFVDDVSGTSHWTALGAAASDPSFEGGAYVLEVRFADGGHGKRIWDNPHTTISIVRDWPEESVDTSPGAPDVGVNGL